MQLHDVSTGELLATFAIQGAIVQGLVYDPIGASLLILADDGGAHVWMPGSETSEKPLLPPAAAPIAAPVAPPTSAPPAARSLGVLQAARGMAAASAAAKKIGFMSWSPLVSALGAERVPPQMRRDMDQQRSPKPEGSAGSKATCESNTTTVRVPTR